GSYRPGPARARPGATRRRRPLPAAPALQRSRHLSRRFRARLSRWTYRPRLDQAAEYLKLVDESPNLPIEDLVRHGDRLELREEILGAGSVRQYPRIRHHLNPGGRREMEIDRLG